MTVILLDPDDCPRWVRLGFAPLLGLIGVRWLPPDPPTPVPVVPNRATGQRSIIRCELSG